MTNTQIVLFIVIAAIILFVIVAIKNYRKQMKSAANVYNEKMLPIEKRMLKGMNEKGEKIEYVLRMLTMQEEPVIFVTNKDGSYASIGCDREVLTFPSSDIERVELFEDWQGKEMNELSVIVKLKGRGTFSYMFSENKFKPTSYVGKIVYNYAREFKNKLDEIAPDNLQTE